jgi:putative flippase GtrA
MVPIARLRLGFLEEFEEFKNGPKDYTEELLRKHRRRVIMYTVVAGGMVLLGNWVIIHSVEDWGAPKLIAKPAWGILMLPVGYFLNRKFVFNDRKIQDAETRRRWVIKVTAFAVVSYGSYELLVFIMGLPIGYVVWGQTCVMSPLSCIATNFWVFRRKVEKPRDTVVLTGVTEMG